MDTGLFGVCLVLMLFGDQAVRFAPVLFWCIAELHFVLDLCTAVHDVHAACECAWC